MNTGKITTKKRERQFIGEVISIAEKKTIHVLVLTADVHPKYKKHYTHKRKYPVHDEKGEAKVGDQVLFIECRPLSKTKRWRLVQVLKHKTV